VLSNLRVGFYTDNGITPPTDDTRSTIESAVESLLDANVPVIEALPSPITDTSKISGLVWGADGGAWQRRLLSHLGTTEISDNLKGAFEENEPLTGSDFSEALEKWDSWRSDMLGFMQNFDALICPVNSAPARLHGEPDVGFSYTDAYSLTGWPAAVVRCGSTPEGLPIGVQIVAPPWREDVALALAQFLENVFGGWQAPYEPFV